MSLIRGEAKRKAYQGPTRLTAARLELSNLFRIFLCTLNIGPKNKGEAKYQLDSSETQGETKEQHGNNRKSQMIYSVDDIPPWHWSFLLGLQVN